MSGDQTFRVSSRADDFEVVLTMTWTMSALQSESRDDPGLIHAIQHVAANAVHRVQTARALSRYRVNELEEELARRTGR
jgi:hypothetical protein